MMLLARQVCVRRSKPDTSENKALRNKSGHVTPHELGISAKTNCFLSKRAVLHGALRANPHAFSQAYCCVFRVTDLLADARCKNMGRGAADATPRHRCQGRATTVESNLEKE